MKRPLTIAIIGPYPPPYGGIAIHVQRLREQLVKNGYECVIYDLGKQEKLQGGSVTAIKNARLWLLRYFFLAREDIIHYQYSDWQLGVFTGLMGLLGKRTVISIVGDDLEDHLKRGNWLRRQVIRFALRHSSYMIAVNSKIRELLLSLEVRPERIRVITPFLPPVIRDEAFNGIPPEIWRYIDSHEPVISANAFRLRFFNGVDLYGLDMCLELCSSLKSAYPRIGFVFCLADIGEYDYFEKIKREIRARNLEDNFLFITQPLHEVYPIWQKSDIFVRPTSSDGDSVSLCEALYLKTPSVASDVISRPEGTVLFKNRDVGSFTESVERVLHNYAQIKRELESVEIKSGINQILEVYSELVRTPKLR